MLQITPSSSRHLYRGHRSASLLVEDIGELTEWRARQRTVDGAYIRTSLSCSFYALGILKLFDRHFAKIGLAYVFLGLAILIISDIRWKRLKHDFSDHHLSNQTTNISNKIWGRNYKTAGSIVILLSICTLTIQISLILLILDL